MAIIDILIKKVEELTRAVNSIRSSSKRIVDLPEISGEDIYVAATNGVETGKFLLQNQEHSVDPPTSNAWSGINLSPYSNFYLGDDKSSYNFIINTSSWSSSPNIKGFNGNVPSDGLVGYVRNAGPGSLIIKHNAVNSAGVTIPFFLSSGSDYSIRETEILSFKYSSERNRCEISVYDLGAIVPLTTASEVFILTEADVSQPNIALKLANIPNVNEFTNVFINGVFVNPHDLIIQNQMVIIAKSNIDYGIREGMKVTINYKY